MILHVISLAYSVVVATALVASLSAPTADDWVEALSRVQRSVVKLSWPTHPLGLCTGFVYGKQSQYVITARHCIFDEKGEWKTFVDGVELTIEKDFGEVVDLLVMRTAKPLDRPSLKLATHAPRTGQAVATLGYMKLPTNEASEASAVFGYVSHPSTRLFDAAPPRLLVHGNYLKGNSGGPIVDVRGHVVSVVLCAGPAGSQWQSLGCGIEWQTLQQLPKD